MRASIYYHVVRLLIPTILVEMLFIFDKILWKKFIKNITPDKYGIGDWHTLTARDRILQSESMIKS